MIQDVDIPLARAADFLAQLHARVGITPVWVCPFRVASDRYPLYRLRTDTPYVNFGFWDTVRSPHPDGHYNALVEQLVAQHDGKKSLYSRSTFDPPGFWAMFDQRSYEALKREYDPTGPVPRAVRKGCRAQLSAWLAANALRRFRRSCRCVQSPEIDPLGHPVRRQPRSDLPAAATGRLLPARSLRVPRRC